jgi:DNA-binding transcriptional regulator YiaG
MKKANRSAGAPPARRQNGHLAARSKNHLFLSTLKTPAARDLAVQEFCDSYSLTHDTFTRLTGFSARTVAHWARGRKPNGSSARRLTELNRLFGTLDKLIAKDTIGPWLKEPNPAFDGSTPLQVVERGESDKVWRMIYELESGEPG